MPRKDLRKSLAKTNPGDLICVKWYDASVGKSSGSGVSIDVPVMSWGVFVGLIGDKTKHIVLAQNSFKYSDGLYDLDYTAIPLSWAVNVAVIAKEHISEQVAGKLVNSFLLGGRRAFSHQRTFQRRVSTHGRPD